MMIVFCFVCYPIALLTTKTNWQSLHQGRFVLVSLVQSIVQSATPFCLIAKSVINLTESKVDS